MAQHILLMNVVAPLLMLLLRGHIRDGAARLLLPAALAQLLLIWGWHSPPLLPLALANPPLHLLLQASLALAALWFWAAIIAAARAAHWRPILALLLTSKLFCLLGVLLVFSPRPLYGGLAHAGHAAADAMSDQQLAGLLMLVACPVTYITAAVVIAARWLLAMDRQAPQAAPEVARA